MLQADGARLWKERNATIALLLSNHSGTGSPAGNQELVGCYIDAAGVGSCPSAAAHVGGGIDSGVCLSPVDVRYPLAAGFASR